jgi:hypothetical protein
MSVRRHVARFGAIGFSLMFVSVPVSAAVCSGSVAGWAPWAAYCVQEYNSDGRLEQFWRGTDNALWHRWQTRPAGPWSAQASLGGSMKGSPTVSRNLDGRLEVFVVGADNALWRRSQTQANCCWGGWGSLGGRLTSNPWSTFHFSGRLAVFARGADNAVWHKWQLSTQQGTGWSGWHSLGGVATSHPWAGYVTNIYTLYVIVVGTDGNLYERHEITGGWSPSWSLYPEPADGDALTQPSTRPVSASPTPALDSADDDTSRSLH